MFRNWLNKQEHTATGKRKDRLQAILEFVTVMHWEDTVEQA